MRGLNSYCNLQQPYSHLVNLFEMMADLCSFLFFQVLVQIGILVKLIDFCLGGCMIFLRFRENFEYSNGWFNIIPWMAANGHQCFVNV